MGVLGVTSMFRIHASAPGGLPNMGAAEVLLDAAEPDGIGAIIAGLESRVGVSFGERTLEIGECTILTAEKPVAELDTL